MKCLRTELLLGRSKCGLDDNIKIALNEIVCGLWISFIWLTTLSQYLALVKSVIDFRGFLKVAEKLLAFQGLFVMALVWWLNFKTKESVLYVGAYVSVLKLVCRHENPNQNFVLISWFPHSCHTNRSHLTRCRRTCVRHELSMIREKCGSVA
jgi:hypothetical protein